MKRRGFNEDIPRPRRIRLPARLGGSASQSSFAPDDGLSEIYADGLGQIYEDQVDDAAVVACADDANPPERSDHLPFQSLAINIMGVDYAGDEDVEPTPEELDLGIEAGANDGDKENFELTQDLPTEKFNTQVEHDAESAPATTDTLATDTGKPVRPAERVADGPSDTTGLVSDFHLAMMLFITASDLSTSQYQALVEVLALATVETLRSLPKSIKTLRERCRKSFPLSHIKARPVSISLNVTPPKTETPRWAYYFDVSEYCRLWLSNPRVAPLLHLGMGEIVDTPTELWHGDAWMESVRSTSGEFARIQESVGQDHVERVLLPSDCVRYRDKTGTVVYGRVKAIGVDKRSSTKGKPYSVIMNHLIPSNQIPVNVAQTNDGIPGNIQYPSYPSTLPELVLLESRDIVPCADIISRVWVYFTDYESPEALSTSLLPEPATFCVRRIIYMAGGRVCIRPIHQRHRVTAEGELIQLTRDYILSTLVAHPVSGGPTEPLHRPTEQMENVGTKTIRHVSLPFSSFLDGFGLYRNAYHSLKGMYITPAGLDVDNRSRLANMFVLMIGPFGCNKLDMATCLAEDSELVGKGFHTTLESGESVFAVSFPLIFTGDMPQQNQNSGNKTHNAEFGCRSCFVPDVQRGNLKLDVLSTGRYQAPIKRLYDHSMRLTTKTARMASLQKYRLTAEGPYFAECYPMLDPQRANPNDPLHAELRLSKYFSEALLDGILSPSGIVAYREAWNQVEVPYGWGQPQNPVSHKGSMVFSEHGRMAIMNPFVLMHLFTNKASQVHSSRGVKTHLKAGTEARVKQSFGHESGELTAKLQILRTSFMLAKTVHLTLKRSLTREEQTEFHVTVVAMRTLLRMFFNSTMGNQGKGGFQKYADVPNIHLGLHYAQDVQNFATSYNAGTMMGEQKHKIFKQHAAHTNSQENDFQLLKLINTTQTIRFLLDGTFNLSSPMIANQIQSVVEECPTLKIRFLGRGLEEETECDGIDVSGSQLKSCRTGLPVALKRIPAEDREKDVSSLEALYKSAYGVTLDTSMFYKVHYWGYLTGKPRTKLHDGQHKFKVAPEGFIGLRDESQQFYRVRRVITITIGTLVRAFLALRPMERDMTEEINVAPYPVFNDRGSEEIFVSIERVEPVILHFVSKGPDSWWYNPFVPHFL